MYPAGESLRRHQHESTAPFGTICYDSTRPYLCSKRLAQNMLTVIHEPTRELYLMKFMTIIVTLGILVSFSASADTNLGSFNQYFCIATPKYVDLDQKELSHLLRSYWADSEREAQKKYLQEGNAINSHGETKFTSMFGALTIASINCTTDKDQIPKNAMMNSIHTDVFNELNSNYDLIFKDRRSIPEDTTDRLRDYINNGIINPK